MALKCFILSKAYVILNEILANFKRPNLGIMLKTLSKLLLLLFYFYSLSALPQQGPGPRLPEMFRTPDGRVVEVNPPKDTSDCALRAGEPTVSRAARGDDCYKKNDIDKDAIIKKQNERSDSFNKKMNSVEERNKQLSDPNSAFNVARRKCSEEASMWAYGKNIDLPKCICRAVDETIICSFK